MEVRVTREADPVIFALASCDSLEASNVGSFKQIVLSRLPSEGSVVIQMAAVQTVDSAGIGALVAVLKAVRRNGGRLGLVGVSAQVRSVLDMIRLTTVFEILPDESAAVAALSRTVGAAR